MTTPAIRSFFAAAALFTLTASAASANGDPAKFAAIWTKPGVAGDHAAFHNLTDAQYQAKVTELAPQGFGPRVVNGYQSSGAVRFAAIFHKESAGWVAHHDMTSAAYQAKFDEHARQGFRLEWVSGYSNNGVANFAAVWSKAHGPAFFAHHELDSAQYQTQFNHHLTQGFRPTVVNPYVVNGQVHYAAIFVKDGTAFEAHHDLTAQAYQAKFNELIAKGMVPTFVGGFDVGGATHISAVWVKASKATEAHHDMTAAAYQAKFEAMNKQGFGLTQVSGYGR